jgi:hypothetical protein
MEASPARTASGRQLSGAALQVVRHFKRHGDLSRPTLASCRCHSAKSQSALTSSRMFGRRNYYGTFRGVVMRGRQPQDGTECQESDGG